MSTLAPTAPPPAAPAAIPTVLTAQAGLERLRAAEWLLTDGQGGFAMGTASGIPTRRYHGLLVASIAPPVQREVLLHSLAERLTIAPGTPFARTFELAAFHFAGAGGGTDHPRGFQHLERFEADTSARWTYSCGGITVRKTLRLVRHGAACVVEYEISPTTEVVVLEVRPLVALRDAHELLSASTGEAFTTERDGRRVRVSRRGRTLELACDPGFFDPTPQWWYRFGYAVESSRGLDDTEDLWSPGVFAVQSRPGTEPARFSLTASLADPLPALARPARGAPVSPARAAEDERRQRARLDELASRVLAHVAPATPDADRRLIARLVAAGDAFVVQRGVGAGGATEGLSIIAGYPWFSDWGRDSAISLPGLLLATRRYDEARRLLETFAANMRHGLVPNMFDDQSGQALYNTVDASLWYIHAVHTYLRATAAPKATLAGDPLVRACAAIVSAYKAGIAAEAEGVPFRIAMDPADGLITAGDEKTQLTWMDAKREGIAFTPRHGKAVEINALWHHALVILGQMLEGTPEGADARRLADRVRASFLAQFWNAEKGCCYDVLTPSKAPPATPAALPDPALVEPKTTTKTAPGPAAQAVSWAPDARIRPNQLFAVSLEYSPLSEAQKSAVLRVVQQHLLTPLGLRTLSPEDPGYKPRFTGRMMERDAAYHNGTVWPWLIGPYVEAALRVSGFGVLARVQARQDLDVLLRQLDEGDALGQLYEVFDGDGSPDSPRKPGGCAAQAWSVAEALRALLLIHSA